MKWSVVATTALLLLSGVASSPLMVEEPATDLMPPKAEVEDAPTLATDLVPPPVQDEDKTAWRGKRGPATLFLINVFAVKNSTAEDSNDVLHDDVIKEAPEESAEPLAVFLLVVEDEDEDHPVSLDEVAKDLEEEGFTVEKVSKDGQTRIVKVDLSSAETLEKVDDKDNSLIEEPATSEQPPVEEHGKLMKVRRKRHLCLKCLKGSGGGGGGGGYGGSNYGGGGCGGGCGGGGGSYYQPPVQQPVYQPQPVIVQPVLVSGGGGGGGYHKKPYGGGGGGGYYPQQQPCNTCGGGGGGYGGHGGGGNSYAQASAQASASASSGSYGGYYKK